MYTIESVLMGCCCSREIFGTRLITRGFSRALVLQSGSSYFSASIHITSVVHMSLDQFHITFTKRSGAQVICIRPLKTFTASQQVVRALPPVLWLLELHEQLLSGLFRLRGSEVPR